MARMDELKFAWRRLRRRPAAVVASVLTLACSIGATAVTWSLLSSALLHPLAISEPGCLMVVGVEEAVAGSKGTSVSTGFTYPVMRTLRDSGVIRNVALGGSQGAQVTAGDDTRWRSLFFVTADFFATIGVPIQLGRDFGAADDRRSAQPVAIVSDAFWRGPLASDPAVVGRTIRIDHRRVEIIGVAARGFAGMSLATPSDVYVPLETVLNVIDGRSNPFGEPSTRTSPSQWLSAFARVGPEDRVEVVQARVSASLPGLSGRSAVLVPAEVVAIPEASRGPMVQFARLLVVTIGLLVLVGCLTVGMLLVLRTEARREEFGMSLALGATRARLALGLVLEGALLALAGAAVAIPVAVWCLAALRTLQLPGGISIAALNLALDLRVIAVVALAAVAATMLTALASLPFVARASAADALRARQSATPPHGRRRSRSALVACQVAATLVLVSGAGVFARSLAAALHVNSGFDTTRLVTGSVSVWQHRFTPKEAAPFFADLRERLNNNPAIASASLISTAVWMSAGGILVVDGIERRFPTAVAETGVDDRYFRTIGLPILRGRDFTAQDDDRAPFVTIVSESFGRMLANGGNPVGMRIRAFHGVAGQPLPSIEVIGVVPDVITDVTKLQPLAMYMSLPQQLPSAGRDVILRPASTIAVASRELLATVRAMDPSLDPAPITAPLMTLDERILSNMVPQRFGAAVLGGLGAIALLLTILGTYVLTESMASARTREMGVRAALGATRSELRAIVLGETARLVGSGLAAGLVLVWFASGTIRALLFRVQPFDPFTLVSAAGLILVLALVVSLRPALAVARVDLARVLRDE